MKKQSQSETQRTWASGPNSTGTNLDQEAIKIPKALITDQLAKVSEVIFQQDQNDQFKSTLLGKSAADDVEAQFVENPVINADAKALKNLNKLLLEKIELSE